MNNFPLKYILIFPNSSLEKQNLSRIRAGFRIALSLLIEQCELFLFFIEDGVKLLDETIINNTELNDTKKTTSSSNNYNDSKVEKELHDKNNPLESEFDDFTLKELLEGIISFGGQLLVCKSSLKKNHIAEKNLTSDVKKLSLQVILKKMLECDQVLVF
jgi:predicted peroxiredoxin